MSKNDHRKFFRTKVTIEIITEDMPVRDDTSLEEIANNVTAGDWSGSTSFASCELSRKQCVAALKKQGSDPEFFQLDDCGNDLKE